MRITKKKKKIFTIIKVINHFYQTFGVEYFTDFLPPQQLM